MGYRILYFYKKENTFYREKNAVNLSFAEKELGGQEDASIKVFFCGLPEYYGKQMRWGRRKKGGAPVPWNFGQLFRLMQNCCVYVSADAYYLEEGFERELSEGEFGYIAGRQRMCSEMLRKLSGQFRGIDSILYLAEASEEKPGELPLRTDMLRKLHYFFYLGEKTQQYALMEENLWQEYGMPLQQIKKTGELATCQMRRLLVLDDRQEGASCWEMLPEGCVYLDLWSNAERRKEICKNRADIKYVSEYLYLVQNLDTPKENRYTVCEGNEQR